MNVYIIDSHSESDEEMSNTTAKVMSKCLMRRWAFYANFRILYVTPLRYISLQQYVVTIIPN
jgi:hypothetical protein